MRISSRAVAGATTDYPEQFLAVPSTSVEMPPIALSAIAPCDLDRDRDRDIDIDADGDLPPKIDQISAMEEGRRTSDAYPKDNASAPRWCTTLLPNFIFAVLTTLYLLGEWFKIYDPATFCKANSGTLNIGQVSKLVEVGWLMFTLDSMLRRSSCYRKFLETAEPWRRHQIKLTLWMIAGLVYITGSLIRDESFDCQRPCTWPRAGCGLAERSVSSPLAGSSSAA